MTTSSRNIDGICRMARLPWWSPTHADDEAVVMDGAPGILESSSEEQLCCWMLVVAFGREGYAAERFAGFRRANGYELVEVAVGRWRCGADLVGDFDQLVGVGAVVAVLADRGRDRVNCGGTVAAVDADHVATSSGRGLDRGGIVRDAIGQTQIKSVLDHVLKLPGLATTRRRGEDPFLQAGGRQRTSVGNVDLTIDHLIGRVDQVALITDVQSRRIREPNPERIGTTRGVCAGIGVGESRENGKRFVNQAARGGVVGSG